MVNFTQYLLLSSCLFLKSICYQVCLSVSFFLNILAFSLLEVRLSMRIAAFTVTCEVQAQPELKTIMKVNILRSIFIDQLQVLNMVLRIKK